MSVNHRLEAREAQTRRLSATVHVSQPVALLPHEVNALECAMRSGAEVAMPTVERMLATIRALQRELVAQATREAGPVDGVRLNIAIDVPADSYGDHLRRWPLGELVGLVDTARVTVRHGVDVETWEVTG